MKTFKHLAVVLTAGALCIFLVSGCSSPDSQVPASATAAPIAAAGGAACNVSELKANPEKYLGALTVNGRAAKVYPEDGVIEIADERACCALYLFVPFTEPQRAKLGTATLYEGTLPAVGTQITADAELTKVEQGYLLKVKEIRSGDAVLVAAR